MNWESVKLLIWGGHTPQFSLSFLFPNEALVNVDTLLKKLNYSNKDEDSISELNYFLWYWKIILQAI